MSNDIEKLREVVIELIDALKAQSAAEMALDHHDQYLERAIGEGWDSDPTGSSWLSGNSAIVRSMERRAKDQRKRVLSARNIRSIMYELDELAALRKENEGMRVDAERYSAVKECPSLVMSFGKLDADGLDDRCDFHNKAKRGNFDHHDAARAAIGDSHE